MIMMALPGTGIDRYNQRVVLGWLVGFQTSTHMSGIPVPYIDRQVNRSAGYYVLQTAHSLLLSP